MPDFFSAMVFFKSDTERWVACSAQYCASSFDETFLVAVLLLFTCAVWPLHLPLQIDQLEVRSFRSSLLGCVVFGMELGPEKTAAYGGLGTLL